jgi:hypothetical protein
MVAFAIVNLTLSHSKLCYVGNGSATKQCTLEAGNLPDCKSDRWQTPSKHAGNTTPTSMPDLQ